MTTIRQMAEFVSRTPFDAFSAETVSHLKMHLLDTVGAVIVGAATSEGRAVGDLAGLLWPGGDAPVIGFPMRSSLLPAVVATCAAARCTEVDDIHLASCTTPGSVIVPTALAFACEGLLDPKAFLTSIALGYDVMLRLGMAIDGARVLYRGVWPTLVTAALGSAAVAAKALRLDGERTAHALASALTMSPLVSGRVKSALPSRWLTLGAAAQNGVIAAFAARNGLEADLLLLDRDAGPLASLVTRRGELLRGLGERFLIDETGVKPYTAARQTLAAVEAFRQIIAEDGVDAASIREVRVLVPGPFKGMIDNANPPETRMESIVSVQYRMALAAFDPAGLFDVLHEPHTGDPRIGTLMARIKVEGDPEMEGPFPAVWPARVEVVGEKGRTTREVRHPKGDVENPLTWDELASKFGWVAGPLLGGEKAGLVIRQARDVDGAREMAPLLTLLT